MTIGVLIRRMDKYPDNRTENNFMFASFVSDLVRNPCINVKQTIKYHEIIFTKTDWWSYVAIGVFVDVRFYASCAGQIGNRTYF